MPDAREVGKVQWFDPVAGYGFIKRAAGKDVFVHHSEIVAPDEDHRQLKPGENVEFGIVPDQQGRARACSVRILPEHHHPEASQ